MALGKPTGQHLRRLYNLPAPAGRSVERLESDLGWGRSTIFFLPHALASIASRATPKRASAKRRKSRPSIGVPYSDAFSPEFARSSSAASQRRLSSSAISGCSVLPPGLPIHARQPDAHATAAVTSS
jgi:hypothetical protein